MQIFPKNAEDTIYYTLDGSIPTRESFVYTDPLLLKNRANEPNRLSTIQTTLPGVGFSGWKLPTGNVYKFNTVRAKVIKSGYYPSSTTSASYIVDENFSELYDYPVISIMSDSVNFFGDTTGIYVAGVGIDSTNWLTAHFSQEGIAWEREIHLEVFDNDKNMVISQDAGVRIGGHYTRTTNIKSLRIYARSEYGQSTLNYKFFPDQEISEYKRMKLRNAGNDAQLAYMRDALVNEAIRKNFKEISRWRPSIVFLDGEYWGIHYLRERHDKYYFKDHYGIDYDELDYLELNSLVLEGSNEHYNAMYNFIKNNDLSDSANYAYVTTQLDPENYIEYLVTSIYTGQTDWPAHNVRYWRKRTSSYEKDAPEGNDGRWRWLLVDQDFGLGRNSAMSYDYDHLCRILFVVTGYSNDIMERLLGNSIYPGNETFRNLFINTFADRMNTTFTINRMLSLQQLFQDTLYPEMNEHINRWRYPSNMTNWINLGCNSIKNFIQQRPAYMRQFIVNDFSLSGTFSLTVNVSDTASGEIKINTIEIDKSTQGLANPNQPYPWSGTYFQGVPVQLIALPNSGYKFIGWLGGSDQDTLIVNLSTDSTFTAIFERTQPIEGEIVINEINYHSPVNKDAGDWIEIINNGIFDFNTTGWKITTSSGFEVIIPQFNLPINHFLVICSDDTKFHSIHPEVQNYVVIQDLNIDSSDETIYLFANEMLLDSVNFSSENPWPIKPDGKGPTLELIESTLDNCQPQNWQASYINGGTPGHINSSPVFAIRINEFMADNASYIKSPEGIYADWIELYNPLDVPVNIGGLYLSDKKTNPTKYLVPSNSPSITEISPKGFLVLWADEKTIYGPLHLNFKLSKDGEFIGIYHANHQQFIDTITFGIQQTDETTGRIPDGKGDFIFFENPTIGEPNGLRQTILINNGWSGISSYLTPYQSQLSEIFSDDLDKMVVLSNNSGIFWPEEQINTLEEWNAGDCFFLKTAEPFDLNISAMTFAGDDFLIQQGWNLVPCLSNQIVNTTDLFETYDELIIVKEIAGTKVYWPLMGIFTLEELTPGKAYLIKASDSFEMSFDDK